MKLTSPDRAALRDLLTRPATAADLKRSLGVETATRRWLTGGVLPLWLWWALVTGALAAWTRYLHREVYGPLAGCRRRASLALRARLGRQWRAFMDARIRDQYQDPPPQIPTCQLRQTRPAATAPRLADPAFAPLACVCPACTHELDPVPDVARPAAAQAPVSQFVPPAGPAPALVPVLPGTAGPRGLKGIRRMR